MNIDLILRGARFLTMSARGTVDAVAVHDGKVFAVGEDVSGLTGTVERDLGGATVLPGFIDAHAHSVWFGLTKVELNVSTATSLSELYELISERAAHTEPGSWVIGNSFNQMRLDGQVPDAAALDRAAGGRPVWLKHSSGHSCVVSRRALDIIGIEQYLPEGIPGGRIVVDSAGRATGLLEEQAMHLVQDLLLPYPLERIEQALGAATAHYLSEGLTSVTDAGIGGGWIGHSPQEFAAYQRALEQGQLHTRQQVMPEASALREYGSPGTEGSYRGMSIGIRSGFGNERLQLGPAKFFLDGSILGATARLTEEYHHCAGSHGYFQGDRDTMRERALAAARSGWSLALHAVGDEAVDLAIDIAGTLHREGVRPPLPHRVEHGGVVRPEQLTQLAEVGLTIVGQPHFLTQYGDGFREFIGDRRSEWSFRSKSVLAAGMPLALSSDRPVAQGAPLSVIQSSIQRRTQTGYVYGKDERLTVHEALAAYTVGAAAVTGWSGKKGEISRGALADLTVLEADPREVLVEDIQHIPVRATILGGLGAYDPEGAVNE